MKESYHFRSYTRKSVKHKQNEDYKIVDYSGSIVIADGVGGSNAGSLASFEAATWINRLFRTIRNKLKGIEDPESIEKRINQAFGFTNEILVGNESRYVKGWQTTLDACLLYNGKVYGGHAGDSRVYHYSNGNLKRLTVDHNVYNRDTEDYTEARKIVASFGYPLSNCVSSKLDFFVDTYSFDFAAGDIMLMVTDGIYKIISDETLKGIIGSGFENIKPDIIRKLNSNSDFLYEYMKYKNITEEEATRRLNDDATFIAVKRDR